MLRGDPEPEPEPVYNPPPPMPVAVAAPVEPPPEIEVLSEKEKKKREKSRKEDAEKAAKAAEKAAADAAAAATAAAAEAAKAPPPEPLPLERAVIRRFTMDVLKPATAGTVPDDPVTRRGVSLVIAGAAAALADTARTTPAGKLQLIEEALTILGVNSASVAMFLHQHDELISIPANASLVALGRSGARPSPNIWTASTSPGSWPSPSLDGARRTVSRRGRRPRKSRSLPPLPRR